MSDEKKDSAPKPASSDKKVIHHYGYQPAEKGYRPVDQPGTAKLDPAKPPQGGSGVPPKVPNDKPSGKEAAKTAGE